MSNFSKTSQMLSEGNVAQDLKKELEHPDWGFTEKGGNGRVKKQGAGLRIYDSFYYGEDEALKSHIRKWSKGGTYEKFFKTERGWNITVTGSGSELRSKLYKNNLGAVWVDVKVTK